MLRSLGLVSSSNRASCRLKSKTQKLRASKWSISGVASISCSRATISMPRGSPTSATVTTRIPAASRAGIEKRIGSFVLMAGVFADEEFVFESATPAIVQFRQRIGEKTLRDFFQQYAFDDPIHFIGRSAPASVFLQFGRDDEPIPEKLARHYFERFAEPKKISFYAAGHALNAEARKERIQWLAERLKLPAVDREAIERIPALEKEKEKEKD